MALMAIHESEEYPSYFLDEEAGRVVLDVPDEVAIRWRSARAAWSSASEEIHEAYRAIEFDKPDAPYPGRRR